MRNSLDTLDLGHSDCLFSDSYRHWYMGKFQTKEGEQSLFGGTSLRWHHIGFSMWGTNVGPSMLIASASAGFTTGIVSGNYAWYAFVFICLLAFVFAPRYLVLVFPPCRSLWESGSDSLPVISWHGIRLLQS